MHYSSRIPRYLTAFALTGLVVLAACSSDSTSSGDAAVEDARTSPTPTPIVERAGGETVVTIYLSSPIAGRQAGTAVLTSAGGETEIEVQLEPARTEVQPIHVHAGTCDEIGSIVANLENVVLGHSSTMLEMPFESFMGPGTLINVHASLDDYPTSMACAPLPELDG